MVETTGSSAQAEAGAAPTRQRIVVGIDGSDGSMAALRWALHEARLRSAAVHGVLGWTYHASWDGAGLGSQFPPAYSSSGGMLPDGVGGLLMSVPGDPFDQSTDADASALATSMLEAALSHAVEQDPESRLKSVTITSQVTHGHGARVLLDEVTESDLLVVGSRGHGAFASALLGSVSHHVVSQARCPVVVVPNPQHTERTD